MSFYAAWWERSSGWLSVTPPHCSCFTGKENQTQVPMGSLDTATTGPDQFKHTQLSQQQIKQFEEDGFLMLRSVFDSSEVSLRKLPPLRSRFCEKSALCLSVTFVC